MKRLKEGHYFISPSLEALISVPSHMVCLLAGPRLERGKYIGERVGPPVSEAEHFIECPDCGGIIDMRDLGIVWDHSGPLPHSVQDQKQ